MEFDNSFTASAPTGIVISDNTIQSIAGECDGIGLRVTSRIPVGSVSFTGNKISTANSGANGKDYGISFDAVTNSNGAM